MNDGRPDGRSSNFDVRSLRGLPWVPQTLEPRDPRCVFCAAWASVDPTSLDEYRAHGGYRRCAAPSRSGPNTCCGRSVTRSWSAAAARRFPAGRKAEAVARSPVRPHYLVCNADESEPGTFKDRVLMEEDPFALVEAMTIAGFATGCEQGYLYIRAEYPLATARLTACDRGGAPARLPRRQRHGRGRPLRHRPAPRRGRLHLRRGNRAAQFHRGPARRAAQQAAVSRAGRPVRQADAHQQRRDVRQPARHRAGRRAVVRRHRHGGIGRHETVLPVRLRRRGRACTKRRSASRCAS